MFKFKAYLIRVHPMPLAISTAPKAPTLYALLKWALLAVDAVQAKGEGSLTKQSKDEALKPDRQC